MIFTAIGTLLAGTATISLFGATVSLASVIAGGLSFAASLGLQYLKRPKKRTYAAVQGETQFGGNVPAGTLYGKGKTKGQRSFYAKWGEGNKYNAEVFLLANGWCDGLEPYLYFFGAKQTLHARPIIGNEVAHYGVDGFMSGGTDLFSIRFYDGRPGQGVDTKLVTDTAALGQNWKATSVNAGIAYVVVERLYDADAFGGKGKPDIEFVMRGLREYDARKDSTIVGGSGPQRINNPSTWVYTENPAVHRFNYQLGLRALLSGRTLIGEGKSIGQIDLASYFVAMNVCDTLRTDGKKTYQCSLWVSGDDDHTEILKEFDDAMAGYGLNSRGLSGVIAGAPQIPELDITKDDIPADRAKEVQYRKSAFERYNHLSGQFISIEDQWNPQSLKPVFVNADVAADGRSRQISNDFLQVSDPDTAQYLLNIRYRQNRKGGTATLPVSRRVGLRVREGQWVTWRGRAWMITEWNLDEKLRCTLKLSETGADVYDDEGIEPGPVIIPPAPVVNPSILTTVQGFNVSAGMITGGNGFDVPALRFVWTPPNDPTITAVRFFYLVEGTAEIFQDVCASPQAGEFTTTKNVLSNAVYSAHATITTVPDRFKSFTPWRTTATTTGALSLISDLAHVGADTRDRFKELQAELDDFFRPRIVELSAAFSLEGAIGEVQRRALRASIGDALAQIVQEARVRASEDEAIAQLYSSLSAQVGTNLARLITEETTRATADSALASSISSLSATVGDNLARLVTEETTRATADSALSSSITSLSGQVGTNLARLITEETARANGDSSLASSITGVSADFNGRLGAGLMKFEAVAAPVGVNVRLSVMMRATLGGAWIETGWYIEIYTVSGVLKSRMVTKVGQYVVDTGSSVEDVFVIEGGVLKIKVAKIAMAQIENLMIGTSNIEVGAITVRETFANDAEIACATVASGSWTNVAQVTVNHGAGSPPITVIGSAQGGGLDGLIQAELIESWTGRVMGRVGKVPLNGVPSSSANYVPVSAAINYEPFTLSGVFNPAPAATQSVFIIRARGFDTGAARNGCINRGLTAFYWKR